MNIKSAGRTHTGMVRTNNEDNIFISENPVGAFPNVFVVADGMGGHKAGEIASNKATAFFCRYATEALREGVGREDLLDFLIDSVIYANKMTYEESLSDTSLHGMGTTFTACVIVERKAYIAHVGDSRIYYYEEGKLNRLTCDHTYVNEMVRAGQLTQEAAKQHPNRNMLTRALGVEPVLRVDGRIVEVHPGGRLLLCSDGLTTMLSDEEIYGLLKEDSSPAERVNRFIDEANAKGGIDNISVILIDLIDEAFTNGTPRKEG